MYRKHLLTVRKGRVVVAWLLFVRCFCVADSGRIVSTHCFLSPNEHSSSAKYKMISAIARVAQGGSLSQPVLWCAGTTASPPNNARLWCSVGTGPKCERFFDVSVDGPGSVAPKLPLPTTLCVSG